MAVIGCPVTTTGMERESFRGRRENVARRVWRIHSHAHEKCNRSLLQPRAKSSSLGIEFVERTRPSIYIIKQLSEKKSMGFIRDQSAKLRTLPAANLKMD